MIERVDSVTPKQNHLNGAASAVTGVGRYVFTPDVFATINMVERQLAAGAELDDIPVLQILLARRRLLGRVLRGPFLDVGLPDGYIEAGLRVPSG